MWVTGGRKFKNWTGSKDKEQFSISITAFNQKGSTRKMNKSETFSTSEKLSFVVEP